VLFRSDSEKNILSYLTPLGKQLMKRKPGEEFTVTLPDGREVGYRIRNIERAGASVG